MANSNLDYSYKALYKAIVSAAERSPIEERKPQLYRVKEGTPFRSGPLGGPSQVLAVADRPLYVVSQLPPVPWQGYLSYAVSFVKDQEIPIGVQGYQLVWISQLQKGGQWM